MRAQVERALASYAGAELAMDRSPTPASHREQFARIERASRALKQALEDLDPRGAAKFRERGVDPRQVEVTVAETRGAALALGEEGAPETRGRPKRRALAAVVRLLRQAFEESAREDGTLPTDRALNLAEFVRIALDEAGIPHPEDLAPLLRG